MLVLADDTANAKFVAADMLAQAEHGSGHERVWLATPSAALIAAVQSEVELQLAQLPRRELNNLQGFLDPSLAKTIQLPTPCQLPDCR